MAQARPGSRARLIVTEDGAPATPLSWSADGPETTIVVGPADGDRQSLARRIDRRMIEAEQSGQAIREAIFLLATRGGQEPCADRLSALLTVIRHLNAAPEVEVALVLPADTPAGIRHEVFALAEVVVGELGAGPNVRIRFVSATPVPHESGFFASARAVSVREPPGVPLPVAKTSEAARLRTAG